MVSCSLSDHPRVQNRKHHDRVLTGNCGMREMVAYLCHSFCSLLTELDSCMVFCSSLGHPRVQN